MVVKVRFPIWLVVSIPDIKSNGWGYAFTYAYIMVFLGHSNVYVK